MSSTPPPSIETTDSDAGAELIDDGDAVELSLPARTRHLRLARLTASGYASNLGFTVDEIEDLRLAVDEACAFLIGGASDDERLRLDYRDDDGVLHIAGRCGMNGAPPPDLDEVARMVLESTVDRFEVGHDGHQLTFRLEKRGTVDLT